MDDKLRLSPSSHWNKLLVITLHFSIFLSEHRISSFNKSRDIYLFLPLEMQVPLLYVRYFVFELIGTDNPTECKTHMSVAMRALVLLLVSRYTAKPFVYPLLKRSWLERTAAFPFPRLGSTPMPFNFTSMALILATKLRCRYFQGWVHIQLPLCLLLVSF